MAEEQEKPLTREDVLKMIEENGGTAEGLDLSGRNLEGIDLSTPPDGPALNLHGINLRRAKLRKANLQQARLRGANLQEADLSLADLQEAKLTGANLQGANLGGAYLQEATLWSANLQEAELWSANLQGADLCRANLQEATLENTNLQGTDFRHVDLARARLYDADLSRETRLEDVDWGPKYILVYEQEAEKEKVKATKRERLKEAESVYRILKQWHTNAGMYDIAGEFYFREMTVRGKALEWWPNPLPRAWSKFLAVLCGYGEKPLNVVLSAAVVVFGLAGIYAASTLTFPSSLYYSAASFTALGYGLWVPAPESWVKALGAIEAFIGVFLIALFLITFVRKMTR